MTQVMDRNRIPLMHVSKSRFVFFGVTVTRTFVFLYALKPINKSTRAEKKMF